MKIQVMVVLSDCTQAEAETAKENIQTKVAELPIDILTIQYNQRLVYETTG